MIEKIEVTGDTGPLSYLFAPAPSMTAGVLAVVHGQGRSVERLINAFAPRARLAGFSVLAPIFSDTLYHGYQRLGGAGGACAAAGAFSAICDDVYRRIGTDSVPTAIAGYSAGGQFAHRYAMAFPGRVSRLVVADAGWYTMPDPMVAFPFGCGPSIDVPGGLTQLDAFLSLPIRVMVGEGDVTRDAGLRVSPALDRSQGYNRLERAQCWTESVRRTAMERGIPPRISFELLPNCGHSAAEAVRKGRFVQRTVDFCLGGAAR